MPLGFESIDALKAYVTCLLMGISLLFAYNALLSTPGYFKDYYKFAENDSEATTDHPDFWKNVVSTIALVFNLPNMVAQASLLHPAARRVKQHTKLLIGLAVIGLALVMIPLVSVFKIGASAASAYLMVCVVACSLGTGLYQSTAVALLAGFPHKFFGICIVGIGVSGVMSNILAIATQAAMPDTYDGHANQSKVFYGASGAVTAATLVALFFFKRNPFAHRYIPEYRGGPASAPPAVCCSAGECGPLLAGGGGDSRLSVDGDGATSGAAAACDGVQSLADEEASVVDTMFFYSTRTADDAASMVSQRHNSTADNEAATASNDCDGKTAAVVVGVAPVNDSAPASTLAPTTTDAHHHERHPAPSAWAIFKLTWPMHVSIFLTFSVTLFVMVMPSIAVAVDPEATWYPVLVITICNVSDTIGRFLPNLQSLWISRRAVLAVAVGRLVLIPLWMICYRARLIDGHVYPYVLMAVTGITNGYNGCMSMIYAPASEGIESEAAKHVSGNTASLMILCGCTFGSLVGWLVTSYAA